MNTYRFVLKMPFPLNPDAPDLRFYSEAIQAENATADPVQWLLRRLLSSSVQGGPTPESIARDNTPIKVIA